MAVSSGPTKNSHEMRFTTQIGCTCEEERSEAGYWRATVWNADTTSPHIHYEFLELVRETACGAWIRPDPLGHFGYVEKGLIWRRHSTLCKTKPEALVQLFHRKLSHVGHARRRLNSAKLELNVVKDALGIDIQSNRNAPSLDSIKASLSESTRFHRFTK